MLNIVILIIFLMVNNISAMDLINTENKIINTEDKKPVVIIEQKESDIIQRKQSLSDPVSPKSRKFKREKSSSYPEIREKNSIIRNSFLGVKNSFFNNDTNSANTSPNSSPRSPNTSPNESPRSPNTSPRKDSLNSSPRSPNGSPRKDLLSSSPSRKSIRFSSRKSINLDKMPLSELLSQALFDAVEGDEPEKALELVKTNLNIINQKNKGILLLAVDNYGNAIKKESEAKAKESEERAKEKESEAKKWFEFIMKILKYDDEEIDVNFSDTLKNTALHRAVLIDEGYDKPDKTALERAILAEKSALIIRKLLEHYRINSLIQNKNLQCPGNFLKNEVFLNKNKQDRYYKIFEKREYLETIVNQEVKKLQELGVKSINLDLFDIRLDEVLMNIKNNIMQKSEQENSKQMPYFASDDFIKNMILYRLKLVNVRQTIKTTLNSTI